MHNDRPDPVAPSKRLEMLTSQSEFLSSPPLRRDRAVRPRGILQLLKAYFSTNRIGDLLLLEGRITEDQLAQALALARTEQRRVGQVLVDLRYVRPHELYAALGKQWGVRSLTWGVALFMSVGTFSPRVGRADDYTPTMSTITQTMNMAALRLPREPVPLRPLGVYPALFRSGERRSEDLTAFSKWTSMFERYDAEMQSDSARAILASWKFDLDRTVSHDLADLARVVDARLNRIAYVDDRTNYGRSDYWATPVEFLRHGGDCEDYAIAKYLALVSLGVPDERLRVAIVQDTIKNMPHAVLIVYTDAGALVLDNQSRVTRWADEVRHYKPIFSINRTAWWLHTGGGESTQVASAAR